MCQRKRIYKYSEKSVKNKKKLEGWFGDKELDFIGSLM